MNYQILVFCEIQDCRYLATQVCPDPDFTKLDICYSYSEVRIEACQVVFIKPGRIVLSTVQYKIQSMS